MCTSQNQDKPVSPISILLELAASDNLQQFRVLIEKLIEEDGLDVNESGLWYGRSIGSKKMKLEERTPLMIASMFGSKEVLKFILGLTGVDVNKCLGSDRATALHLAVAGGSSSSVEVVKLLIECSCDTNCLDVHGNRPVDLIPFVFGSVYNATRKLLEVMLNGYSDEQDINHVIMLTNLVNDRVEEQKMNSVSPLIVKKEYPVDLSLPDMKNGIYNTDEFRMYSFKIKPCSRAYSHDWTECPFVHPGENARRRDPRKYHYSCVPCPEFRKGSCKQGDNCEYAHGIFECWLHPAQYRTRLCKDEIGCSRKVCFFAHKPEELRPLHPSTGSAYDISSVSPFSMGSLSTMVPQSSTPPITPVASSPRGGVFWSNQSNRLDLETELMMVDRYRQQQLIDEFARVSSGFNEYFDEYDAVNGSKSNHESFDYLGSGISLDSRISPLHQNMRMSSPSSFGANQIMNSRAIAFAKRSQSFVDRGAVNRQSMTPSKLSGWGSPDGKLDWGIQRDELNKLRKSASFGVHRSHDSLSATNNNNYNNNHRDTEVPFDEEQFSALLEQEQLA